VVFQPQIWDRLLQVMGREDLLGDPRYSTPAARLDRLAEVYALVESWTMQHTKFEVNEKLNAIDVPCGPILDTSDLIDDAHLQVREMIVDVPHAQRGTFKTVGSPLKLSDSPVEITPSPLLSEHTTEVLREVMGYDKEKVDQLRKEGVV
jgi:formyl-CoA transferase